MKIAFLEKFARWYLHKYFGETYYTLKDINPAILKAKENEGVRLNKIHTSEKDEIRRLHQLDLKLAAAEAEAEIARMSSEMDLMIAKVKNAQEVYYETLHKAKVTDSVVSDMATQIDNVNKLTMTIYGCMEGIKKRAKDHAEALAKAEIGDRERLSLPESVGKMK